MLSRLKKHEPSIALVGALAALGAAVVALLEVSQVRTASEAAVYLTLRDRYFDVWLALPKEYDDLEIDRDHPDWPIFKRYWYVSFDEWYVTQRIGAFSDLWDSYYKEAFLISLDKRSMRNALCLLKESEFSAGTRRDFARALEEAYSERSSGRELCTPPSVALNPALTDADDRHVSER